MSITPVSSGPRAGETIKTWVNSQSKFRHLPGQLSVEINTFDALKAMIGQQIGLSEWLIIDQAMIDKFADATGDHQFIHVDPQRAAQTEFGGTIAHGFLTLSLMPALTEKIDLPRLANITIGLNYGSNRCRFLTPVRSGKQIRGHFKLLDIHEKRSGQFQQTVEYSVEIEGEEKPALIAEWITQFFTSPHQGT
jgi:acyl dehydratase